MRGSSRRPQRPVQTLPTGDFSPSSPRSLLSLLPPQLLEAGDPLPAIASHPQRGCETPSPGRGCAGPHSRDEGVRDSIRSAPSPGGCAGSNRDPIPSALDLGDVRDSIGIPYPALRARRCAGLHPSLRIPSLRIPSLRIPSLRTPSPGAPGRTAPQCCGRPLVESPSRAANRRAAPSAGAALRAGDARGSAGLSGCRAAP